MEAFIYLAKSMAILSIFYGVYILFFRKDTLFKAKRYFFLGGIFAAIILPFLTFTKTVYIEKTSLPELDFGMIDLVPIAQTTNTTPLESSFDWWLILYGVYAIGLVVLLIRFCIQLLSLLKVLKHATNTKVGNYRFVETEEQISPFSFFKYIVYNPKQHNREELSMILQHEKIHALQWHSIDILAANLLRTIQWINPFSWLYKKSLEENLEFIADQETITQVASKKQYQLTLVKNSSPLIAPALTTQFYQSFIKKRIIMLNKSNSQKRNTWKLTFVLPLLCFYLWSFNVVEEIKYIEPETTTAKVGVKLTILPAYTDAELDQLETFFRESTPIEMKISNRKRDVNEHIIAFDFQTKFEGQDTFYTRFSQVTKEENTSNSYKGHSLLYHDDALHISEIGPKATSFKITKDRISFVDETFITPMSPLTNDKQEAIIITSEISEDQLNAIEKQLEAQSNAFEILFKDRKRNTSGELVELSIDTKYEGQPRFYKNVTYGNAEDNKTISALKLQVIDHQLHFGNKDGSMLNKITPDGVVGLTFQKKENTTNEMAQMGENPLYLINGKEYFKKDLPANTNFEVAEGIEILYPKEAIKKYGNKGKDGVFIFKGITTFVNDEVVQETNNPNQVTATITKTSPPAVFKKIKQELLDFYDVELRYIDQRNEKGEINNLAFYFFKDDKEIGTLGLGLYDPAPIETSTFYYTKNGRFNFWNATKHEKLKQNQEVRVPQQLPAQKKPLKLEYDFSENGNSTDEIYITKNTTDGELLKMKKQLLEKEIQFIFKDVKRNSKGELIGIKIHVTNPGSKAQKLYASGNTGLPINDILIKI